MSLASEPFDFGALVSSVSSFTYGSAVAKGITFNLFASSLLGKIYVGDPLRIKQVLMNLLPNALKFAPETRGQIAHHAVIRNHGTCCNVPICKRLPLAGIRR